MKKLPFTKMHGTGNDFVVLDALKRPIRVTAALARRLCDRRFGVGADQVLVLDRSSKADFKMLIYNADGSQVEMCGNGIRCLARYAHDRGHTSKKEFTVDTLAGVKRPCLERDVVRVDMGEPELDAARLPSTFRGRLVERSLPGLGLPGVPAMTGVSMGNPHAVFFVQEVDAVPLETWGPKIETHRAFPRRTNVEFVQVTAPDRARVRVWERGAGVTLACGTGACASAVAGVLTGRLHRRVTLALPGGNLGVVWAENNHVYLSGPAVFVYDGVFAVS
jgi:diaminopimelate epimerase